MTGASAVRTRTRADSDPLSRVLKPSAGETPQERQARLEQEALARKISDTIDEQLRKEKMEKTRSRKEIRVLLLGKFFIPRSRFPSLHSPSQSLTLFSEIGQSESGKR